MNEIKDKKDDTLALLMRNSAWKNGLSFLTKDEDFIQAGTWWYEEGKKLDRHYHNEVERKTYLTQECIVVLCGSVHVNVYDSKKDFVTEFVMEAHDVAVFLKGGHSYEILTDNTKIVEVKNGPFLGVDVDKTRF